MKRHGGVIHCRFIEASSSQRSASTSLSSTAETVFGSGNESTASENRIRNACLDLKARQNGVLRHGESYLAQFGVQTPIIVFWKVS
jgi:hypothetical protein